MKHESEKAFLTLADGSVWEGYFFGYIPKQHETISGEVVFNTGMVGYPETLTDPSYAGQILIETYPLVGNYGVPALTHADGVATTFESDHIHTHALIVSTYTEHYSHWEAVESLGSWLAREKRPGIYGIDTRALTKHLREHGAMLGVISTDEKQKRSVKIDDPNEKNLVEAVSRKEKRIFTPHEKVRKTVLLVDCGAKNNIIRSLLTRNVRVIAVPWDYDFLNEAYDGILISNGPGDPQKATKTITTIRKALTGSKPIFGICLGNQILALAAGAKTYKLPYGHRSHNQPCIDLTTKRCYITSQNHGYAVDTKTLPNEWNEWFINANDSTNEGIRHKRKPFFSVQFHPEATAGPTDTEYLFDDFIRSL